MFNKKCTVLTWGAAVVLLSACASESAVAPDLTMSANRQGVSQPQTTVTTSAVFTQAGSTVIRQDGSPGNSGQGTCILNGGGAWLNPGGQTAGAIPHPQCLTVVDAVELTITFSDLATYVLSANGNIQLNFSADPTLFTARGVQYKRNQNYTDGFGVLYGTDENGGSWTLLLDQISNVGPGGLAAGVREFTGLTTCRADDATYCASNGTMSW
jgi:hypothetical protein